MQKKSDKHTVVNSLAQKILAGDYGTEGYLPKIASLKNEYSCTTATMQDILEMLQLQGLIIKDGAKVLANPQKLRILQSVSPTFEEQLRASGRTPYYKNIGEPSIIELSEEYAEELELPQGMQAIRRYRFQGEKKGQTIIGYRLAETFYSIDLVKEVLGDMWQKIKQDTSFNLLAELEKARGETTQATSKLHQRFPTQAERDLLKIPAKMPMIDNWHRCYNDRGDLLMFNRIAHVGPFFDFRYEFRTKI